jgi:hypothetical protein
MLMMLQTKLAAHVAHTFLSNKDMQILKKKYFKLFSDDLGKVLDSELGGPFEKLVL